MTPVDAKPNLPRQDGFQARLRRRTGYAWPALATAVIVLFFNAAIDHSFLHPADWASILAVAMPFMLVAMAAVPAILSGGGGIDLSVGPLAGLVNAVLVSWLFANGFTSPAIVLPVTLVLGGMAGALNGILIVFARIPPIIATLGTYLIWSGVTLEVLPVAGGKAPDWLIALSGSAGLFPLPILMIAFVALLWWPVQRSAFGRNLLATGGDQRAAFASGIEVGTVRIVAYTLGGVIAAIAGFAFTAALGSGDPLAAGPYTLIGVAGAVLGGVSLAGGRGGLIGACAGGAVLFLVQNLLSLAHVSAFYAQVAYGLILIAALAVNSLGNELRRKRDRIANARTAGN